MAKKSQDKKIRTLERQVEASETVAGQAVGAALQHDGARVERRHDLRDHRLEDRLVDVVVDA